MSEDEEEDHVRLPRLYWLWDLQFVIGPGADYEVLYAETSRDGTPLFMVFRRGTAARERLQ